MQVHVVCMVKKYNETLEEVSRNKMITVFDIEFFRLDEACLRCVLPACFPIVALMIEGNS